MSRYINADSLIPETVEVLEYGGDDGRRLYSRRIKVYSKKQIDEAPTADVVEVVRCKDCTRQMICFHSDDYFCADGERRTDE